MKNEQLSNTTTSKLPDITYNPVKNAHIYARVNIVDRGLINQNSAKPIYK